MKKLIKKIISIQSEIYIWLIKRLYSVKPNTIVFQSRPDFGDNPRALFDYLEANGYTKKYKIYWIVKNKFELLEKGKNESVKFFRLRNRFYFYKWQSFKLLLTSQFVFCSHGFTIPVYKGMKGQKYINLWHGCGYKFKISKHDVKRFFDLSLVPGPLFIETKMKCWKSAPEYFLAKGYPRYDWMLNPTERAEEFMKQFKYKGKKVIMWMPTYRNTLDNRFAENVITQFPLMATGDDWKKLDEKCRDNSVVLLVKLHISQCDYGIDFSQLTNIIQLSNEDFEKAGVQMYEFLALTDGLISDYSSVAVDYLVVDKPLAFALDDFELYKNARGFVFDDPKQYMPGHHLYTAEDLYGFLSDVAVNNDKYKDDRKRMAEVAIYKSQNYCKEIVESIGL